MVFGPINFEMKLKVVRHLNTIEEALKIILVWNSFKVEDLFCLSLFVARTCPGGGRNFLGLTIKVGLGVCGRGGRCSGGVAELLQRAIGLGGSPLVEHQGSARVRGGGSGGQAGGGPRGDAE